MSEQSTTKKKPSRTVWIVAAVATFAIIVGAIALFAVKPAAPEVSKEAGLITKDVNVCYFNDSSQKIEFTKFRYTDGNPIGTLRPGNTLCISGERVIAYLTYSDGYSTKTIAWNSEVLYPEVSFETINLGVPTASSYFSEGETVGMVDEDHNWSITRLDNTSFVEFEYHYLGK